MKKILVTLISLLATLGALGCDSTEPSMLDTDGGAGGVDAGGAAAIDAGPGPTGCLAAAFLDLSQAAGAGGSYPAPTVSASCTDDTMVVTSNGIPHYLFIQTTPNALQAQNNVWELPLAPQVAAAPTDIPLLGFVAVAVNGLPVFGPNEAGMPADTAWGDPVYNNITDMCLGHTAMMGRYHNHALPEKCLLASNLVSEPWASADPPATEPSPIVGFAADGFPIYGPRECTDAACTAVQRMRSSWDQIGDPTTDAWDAYQYAEKPGPEYLDRCNGHVGPNGDYHYHATDGFPYVLGCYRGTPAAGL